MAGGYFRVPFEGPAFVACRCTTRLVLHAGQPSELGHRFLAAVSKQLTVCIGTQSLDLRSCGAKSPLQHLHEAQPQEKSKCLKN